MRGWGALLGWVPSLPSAVGTATAEFEVLPTTGSCPHPLRPSVYQNGSACVGSVFHRFRGGASRSGSLRVVLSNPAPSTNLQQGFPHGCPPPPPAPLILTHQSPLSLLFARRPVRGTVMVHCSACVSFVSTLRPVVPGRRFRCPASIASTLVTRCRTKKACRKTPKLAAIVVVCKVCELPHSVDAAYPTECGPPVQAMP